MFEFKNVGRTIKNLAKIINYVGIGVSLICWVYLLIKGAIDDNTTLLIISLAVAIGGSLVSWIQSVLLYGFGSLIENCQIIADFYTRKR